MTAQEGTGAGPGLGQLGIRLGVGALLVLAALLALQHRSQQDREGRAAFPLLSGNIRVSALSAPVEILRDERGIPHVLAAGEREGWVGLGFAHAQDRLAQMLWLRRRTEGRTAEIEGGAALPADRLARLLAITRAAEEGVAALPQASRAVLEAYAEGVNARLARIQRGLSDPPRLLREPVEDVARWRPADSLAIGKLLSWCMGGTLETTLVLDDLIQRLDSVPARPFFPGNASVDFGISPGFDVSGAGSAETGRARGADEPGGRRPSLESTRRLCQGIGMPTGGAWVVEGGASASGAPLVVADWHLEPSVPALFYEARVAAGKIQVAGATIPGSPLFWAGRNRDLAWAGVPASAPIADLFIETLRPERGLYQNGTLWVPIEESQEVLRWRDARGGLNESEMTIRSTRHGPLIDALADPDGPDSESPRSVRYRTRSGLALAWTGARAGDGISSMLGLIRASDVAAVEAALSEHHEPVLAVAFAHRAGEGGVQLAGWLPRRPLPTGLVPVQGRLRSFDWRERVPLEDLPGARLGEGAHPWLLAVDQPWPSAGGLDQMEWLWRPGDRAARLEAELRRQLETGPVDLRTAADLLRDDQAQRAPAVVAAIVTLARRAGPLPLEAREIADLLTRWDGRMSTDSAGAAAYHVVLDHLLEALLEGPFGASLLDRYLNAPYVRPREAIQRLLLRAAALRRAGGWTDESRVSRASRDALRIAWVSLTHRLGPTVERWEWGSLHRLRFRTLGPPQPLPGPLGRAFAIAGNGETLDLARHRAGISFDVEHASLYRIAMDLAASDRLLSVLAPGQSEHPGHRHFDDGLMRWRSARLSLFPTSRLVIEEESPERLVLEPAP